MTITNIKIYLSLRQIMYQKVNVDSLNLLIKTKKQLTELKKFQQPVV